MYKNNKLVQAVVEVVDTLGVTGSNKLVTTLNSILTELFYGLRPKRITIISEEKHEEAFIKKIRDALVALGINVEVDEIVIGKDPGEWAERLKGRENSFSVIDITPGRKYMSIMLSKLNSKIRYVYLKEESEGYRIFGYVSPKKVEVWELYPRPRVINKMEQPKPSKEGRETILKSDSITAFINILDAIGEVTIRPKRRNSISDYTPNWYDVEVGNKDKMVEAIMKDQTFNLCASRSGMIRFKGEDEVKEKIEDGANICFDTNVIISIGHRIFDDIGNKRYLSIPLFSVYNELKNHSMNYQRNKTDRKTMLFILGLYSFNKMYSAMRSPSKSSGDVPIIKEVTSLKVSSLRPVLVTMDKSLGERAGLSRIEYIVIDRSKPRYLENPRGSIGKLLSCLSSFSDVSIEVNGEEVATIVNRSSEFQFSHDGAHIIPTSKDFNYVEMLKAAEL